MNDPINHPAHYTNGPIECIELSEGLDFLLGSAMKYLYRVAFGGKENDIQDLKKCIWYIERKLEILENEVRTDLSYKGGPVDETLDTKTYDPLYGHPLYYDDYAAGVDLNDPRN